MLEVSTIGTDLGRMDMISCINTSQVGKNDVWTKILHTERYYISKNSSQICTNLKKYFVSYQ